LLRVLPVVPMLNINELGTSANKDTSSNETLFLEFITDSNCIFYLSELILRMVIWELKLLKIYSRIIPLATVFVSLCQSNIKSVIILHLTID
jgi:hypothetical protein